MSCLKPVSFFHCAFDREEEIDKADYQGYQLTTVPGFDVTRRKSEVEGTRTRTRGFLTVYAGVER